MPKLPNLECDASEDLERFSIGKKVVGIPPDHVFAPTV